MEKSFIDLFGWWIAVIELPILSALFWLIWNSRREFENGLMKINQSLADHRIEVARTYAETRDIRIIENRLTAHLLRIEAKLDTREK
ncbi:MAG: hypothetical protein JNL76_03305 [Alphaproteobacteria bacterium]|jgi:hypothetical protein|nr:hypothetical protein [Alphaproteobacteria bacterium]